MSELHGFLSKKLYRKEDGGRQLEIEVFIHDDHNKKGKVVHGTTEHIEANNGEEYFSLLKTFRGRVT